MPLTRWIISSNDSASSPAKDAIVNTLYFNVSGSVDQPDYTNLANDLYTIWGGSVWSAGRYLDIRGYDMDDPKPRPQKVRKTGTVTGTSPQGPRQVALALSYYADRNLPRQRGRLFIGPWSTSAPSADATQVGRLTTLAGQLANLGGVNVDWSLYSPTTNTHTRISMAWVDNSWDIIRSRKLPPTLPRQSVPLNG